MRIIRVATHNGLTKMSEMIFCSIEFLVILLHRLRKRGGDSVPFFILNQLHGKKGSNHKAC